MFTKFLTLVMLYNFSATKSVIEPKVVGYPTDISLYPHSAFMFTTTSTGSFMCGASILNQQILLTAAHCIEKLYISIVVYTGSTDRTQGTPYQVEAVKPHENYNRRTVYNDIGLLLVKTPIKLGKFTQRVSISSRQTSHKTAFVAGWGLIDEVNEKHTHILHHAKLKVWTHRQCQKYVKGLPKGCICGRSPDGKTYPSRGDSGSALMVNNYTQIGVVSYKNAGLISIVAFSSVPYYFHWIKHHSKKLYCTRKFQKMDKPEQYNAPPLPGQKPYNLI